MPQDSLAEVFEEMSTRKGTFKALERWSKYYRGWGRGVEGGQDLNEDREYQEKDVASQEQIVVPLGWSWDIVRTHGCVVGRMTTHHECCDGVFLEWHGAGRGDGVSLSEECTCERAEDVCSPSLSTIDVGGQQEE